VRVAFVTTFSSVVYFLLSYLLFVVARRSTEAYEVLFLDGALFWVILFFRILKASENVLAPLFVVTDCKAFTRPRKTQGYELPLGIGLLLLYAACFLGAWISPMFPG
jgi:hypothetical protein